MKTNNKTTKAIRPMGAGLLAAAMGAVLLLNGCAGGGGGASGAATAAWPPATPPATSQANTYVGTQNPGWMTVTIDHTDNTFSYQNLSTGTAAVSGTFTTAANGTLVLTTSSGQTAYALEQLSLAVLLVPPLVTAPGGLPLLTDNVIFAINAPTCQEIPSRTQFEYASVGNANYGLIGTGYDSGTSFELDSSIERLVGFGLVGAVSTDSGQNWSFGGELQYLMPNAANGYTTGTSVTPSPAAYSGACASGVIQTAITTPSSVPASFAVGPTGYFVEDRFQSDGVSFAGAVQPTSPVDLSQLSGASFLGVYAGGGGGSAGVAAITDPELVSFSAAVDSSGTSIVLTGGEFPNNDPTQTPGSTFTIDLGTQSPDYNGSFPSAGGGLYDALVTNVGGKYVIFLSAGSASEAAGFFLFQQ